MERPVMLGRRRALALAACCCAWWTPVPAQEHTPQQRLDALLDVLAPPVIEQLLEPLGPRPPLESLLQPLPPEHVALLEIRLSDEARERGAQLDAERDSLAETDLEAALVVAREVAQLVSAELGPEHPESFGEQRRVRELEIRARMAADDWRALDTGRAGLREVVPLYRAGRRDEALTLLVEQAELERELLGADAALAMPLGSMATILHAQGDYLRAERVARAGLAAALVEYGPRHFFVARSLNDLAVLSTAFQRLDDAEALNAYSLALRRDLYGDRRPEFALALMRLADLYRLRNELERAGEVIARAIEVLEALGTMPDRLGVLLMQRGVLEWSRGDDGRARESLQESVLLLERAHSGDHSELANATGLLADIARGSGHYRRSLELAERSLAMFERLYPEDHPFKAQAFHRFALVLEVFGELERAEQAYRAAISSMEAVEPAAGGDLVLAIDGLASLLARKGDVQGAQALSERVLALQRATAGPTRRLSGALVRLSQRRAASGDLEGATSALREALEIALPLLGPEHPRFARLRVELAELMALRGESNAARELVEEVLDELGQGADRDPRAFSDASCLAAQLAFERGELEPAAEHVARCLEARRGFLSAPHPALVEALALMGELHEASGELDAAALAYSLALQQADSLRTRILGDERDRARYASELDLGRLARSLARVQLALGYPRAALRASERGRERALLDLLERSGSDLVTAARARAEGSAEALAEQLEREAEAQRTLLHAEQKLRRAVSRSSSGEQELVELEDRVRAARRRWRAREGDLEACLRAVWPSARPVAPDALLATLRADEALLHYTFDERGVGVVALRGGAAGGWLGLSLAADAESSGRLSAQLVGLIEKLRSGTAIDPGLRRAVSQALMPAAVWEHIGDCSRLVIVPDGALHELPFEVLLTPSGPWLQHGPRLCYNSSAALFARGREGRERSRARPARALVLGDPDFASGALEGAAATGLSHSALQRARLFGGRLSPLPGTAVEARRVAAVLATAGWEVESLLGTEACAPRLLERAGGATLVHLATHGLAAERARPYDSALALAAPESLSAGDDGFLTLDDLVRRWGGVLRGCDLVVLSACDTQVGVPLGESRVALSWGFFFAGSDSVLVSLWKVDDRATVLLMERFYANYTGRFEGRRSVGAESFEGGVALPEDAALHEAKAWLARSEPAWNRARLAELGFTAELSGDRGQFPVPGAEPSSTATEAAFDFRAARFGSAFVLYGQPD